MYVVCMRPRHVATFGFLLSHSCSRNVGDSAATCSRLFAGSSNVIESIPSSDRGPCVLLLFTFSHLGPTIAIDKHLPPHQALHKGPSNINLVCSDSQLVSNTFRYLSSMNAVDSLRSGNQLDDYFTESLGQELLSNISTNANDESQSRLKNLFYHYLLSY